ncbi:MAG: cytochrome c peroxidase [Polyangiales bacterium]
MDLSQRRSFAIGTVVATVAGLSVGVAATRDAPPPERAPTAAQRALPRTLPTHTQSTQPVPAAQNCLLPDRPLVASSTPRQSGSVHLSTDQRTIAVADSDNDTVTMLALDGAQATILSRITTGEGPAHVLVSADGRAFVTERRSATVSVYDGRTGRKLCTTQVAQDPYAMALSSDGRTLLVTSGASAKLTAIDTQTLRTRWVADTAREPRAVAFNRSGSRAVLSHLAGKPLSVLDVSDDRPRALEVADAPVPVETQRVGGALSAEESGHSRMLAAQTTGLRDIVGSPGRGDFRHTFSSPPIAVSTAQVRPVPSQAWSLAAMVESDEIVVPFMVNRTGRELPAIARVDRYGGGSVSEQRQNEKVTFALGVFDPNTLQWKRFEMPNGVRNFRRGSRESISAFASQHAVRIPMAATFDPRTGALIVASTGTSELASITLASPAASPVSTHASEVTSDLIARDVRRSRPQTIGFVNPSVVTAQHDETLPQPSGLVTTSDGVTIVYSQFEHAIEVRKDAQRNRVSIGGERLPQDVARGRRLFYTANNPALTSGGLSCGGCHPDGRDDGLVWFLANGPRQTPTLAARLVAPFNWTGSHRTIEGNVAQTVTRLGGTGMPIADVDAIAAYVQRGIDAPRAEPPVAPPSDELVARGREVFMTNGNCASCHDPARNFTDGQSHELGGLGSDERERLFDTPSLRFVRATGPFFHDGRYQTLRQLLTDATARMGNIGQLSLPDVEALEAFLVTL